MTGDPGLSVTPEKLAEHAGTLELIGTTVQHALAAAGQIRLGGSAYGRLCQALPTMLEPLHDTADQALREARGSLDEAAYALRRAAEGYRTSDQTAANRVDPGRLGSVGPPVPPRAPAPPDSLGSRG